MTHEIAAAWIVGGFIMANRNIATDKKFMGMTPAGFFGTLIIFTLTFISLGK